ncbi:MAG: hypothetical protein RR547_00555 [Raoultibacter sp.]
MEATPADKLAVIGNGLVLIAATGPVLMVAGAALKGLSAVMAATAAVTKTAANAQLTYTMLVNSSTAATKVATVATSALRAAQITLNAAMLTNPAGVALLAIVALVGGVLALKVAYDSLNAGNESVTAATKAQGEEVDELRGKYESLKESTGESSEETLKAKAALDAAEESYRKIYQTMDSFIAESDAVIQKHQEMMAKMDDTVSAADEEAGSLLALGDRLSELSGHVEGDTAKKAELSAVVSALNGEIEGLNIVINEQTGEIEGSTEAVYGLIKAEANRIQSKANYEKLAEAIKQESALIDQLAEAQENLSVASKEAVVGHDQFGNEIVFVESEADKCQKTIDDLTGQIEVNRAEQEKAVSVLEKVASKEAALEQAVNAVKDGHLGAADAAAKYSNANNDIVITAEEVTEKLEVVKQEIDENVQAIKDYAAANPAFERAMENAGFSADTLNSHLGDLELEFDDLSAKFEECVTDISSGLEVLDTNSQISLSKLVENLRINAEATSNWKDNCMAVWNSVPAELEPAVQSMIEAGPDKFGLAMQQLAGLSEEELTDMVRQMAGYTDSTTQSLADLLMQTSEFGATLAQNLRLPDGSLNYTAIAAALNSAGFDATAIASLTSDQIAAALGIDPSEIDMSQITAAVQSEEPKAVDASAEAGGNSGEAYSDANTEGIESRKSQVASAAVSVISNAATTAAPIASTGGYMVGTNLGLGIASGLRGSSGLITAASVSAVNNAVAAAKRAGEIHSPSRRTEREIGKQMIAGAARGVTRNSHLFESAMAHSVNRSIDAVPINTNMRTRVVPAFNTSALQGSSAVMTRRDVSDAVTTAFGNLGFAEMGVYIDEDKLIGYTAKKTDRALGKIKRNSGGL